MNADKKTDQAFPRLLFPWILATLIACCTGCGYSVDAVKKNIPKDIQTISIPYAENSSTRPRLAGMLTNELRLQFMTSKYLALVDNADKADSILSVKIVSFKVVGATLTDEDRSSSRRITVLADVQFKRRDSNQVLYQVKKLAGRQTYIVDTDKRITDMNEEAAMAAIARTLAGKIHSAVFEGF